MTKLTRIFAAALMSAAAITGAGAADFDIPLVVDQAPEYVPVEIGSGWYLRGDIGYSPTDPFENEFSASPDTVHKSSALNGTVGFGYVFNNYLRGDLNVGYTLGSSFERNFSANCNGVRVVDAGSVTNVTGIVIPCIGSSNGESEVWEAMANAYVDLGTFAGFTPYVGAGLGISYSSYEGGQGERVCRGTVYTQDPDFYDMCIGGDPDAVTAPITYAGTPFKGRDIGIAWSLAAGAAYQLTNNTKLDLGYRYVNMPGAAVLVDDNGTVTVDESIDVHQVRVGLRYEIW